MNYHVVNLAYPPIGLRRTEAAAYVGVGTTLFDEMVDDGRMPEPRRAGRRKIWIRPELEAHATALPVDGESENDDTDAREWDEALG